MKSYNFHTLNSRKTRNLRRGFVKYKPSQGLHIITASVWVTIFRSLELTIILKLWIKHFQNFQNSRQIRFKLVCLSVVCSNLLPIVWPKWLSYASKTIIVFNRRDIKDSKEDFPSSTSCSAIDKKTDEIVLDYNLEGWTEMIFGILASLMLHQSRRLILGKSRWYSTSEIWRILGLVTKTSVKDFTNEKNVSHSWHPYWISFTSKFRSIFRFAKFYPFSSYFWCVSATKWKDSLFLTKLPVIPYKIFY